MYVHLKIQIPLVIIEGISDIWLLRYGIKKDF